MAEAPIPPGTKGIEAANARTRARIEKIKAIDWDKVKGLNELKDVVKLLACSVINEDTDGIQGK